MKNKQTTAVILSLICSAGALLAAIFFINPSPAPANFAVKDRDYQVVTAQVQNGSDALYILNQRSGMMAVFTYESGKGIVLRGSQAIGNAFGAAAPAQR